MLAGLNSRVNSSWQPRARGLQQVLHRQTSHLRLIPSSPASLSSSSPALHHPLHYYKKRAALPRSLHQGCEGTSREGGSGSGLLGKWNYFGTVRRKRDVQGKRGKGRNCWCEGMASFGEDKGRISTKISKGRSFIYLNAEATGIMFLKAPSKRINEKKKSSRTLTIS